MENKELQVPAKKIFEDPTVQERFRAMLKDNTAGFMTSIIQIVNNSDDLQKADRNSLLFAAANAASMNLPINPNLGFAYVIPYNKKIKTEKVGKDGKKHFEESWITLAQFQMGYKGFIQLAMRSGQFKTISGTAIYEGQLVESNPLTGFKFDFEKKHSDKIIGYAGYFSLVNGFEKTLYMAIDDLRQHGLRYSKTFKKGYGVWEDNFEAMAIKTVLKLLLSKYAPLSIDMQRAVISDQAVVNDWEGVEIDYVDNKPLKLEENKQAKEEERITDWIENAKTIDQLEQVKGEVGNYNLLDLYKVKHDQLSSEPF